MMYSRQRDVKISISGIVFLILAAASLVLPMRWLMAAVLAAGVHELCHVLAISLLHGEIEGIKIHPFGVVMMLHPMEPGKEIVCALAGPLGGAALLLFLRVYPELALCACIHSVYNMLPLPGLDGARIISGLFVLCGIHTDAAQKFKVFCHVLRVVLLVSLVGYTILYGQLDDGLILLMADVLRTIIRKIYCKDTFFAVQ